jgi:lipopolysaccharide heptosyltransferase I
MKILVIKPSSLGDVIHSMPFLKALKDLYPDAQIDWVISQSFQAILEGHPLINRLILFNKDAWRKKAYWRRTLAEIPAFYLDIRAERYDLTIDLQGLLRSGLITFFAWSPKKIGFDVAREGSKFFYHQRVKTNHLTHAVDRYLEVVRALALPNVDLKWDRQKLQFPLPIQPEAAQRMAEKLQGVKDYVVVAPSARWETKRWDPEFFGNVIAALQATSVIVGSPSDQPIAREVLIASQNKGIDFTGKTDLKELVALIAQAKALLSNDSGPIHIAAALKVPVVALFGPTDPYKTGPYGWDFPHSASHAVMADVSCRACLKRKCPTVECHSAIERDQVIEILRRYL